MKFGAETTEISDRGPRLRSTGVVYSLTGGGLIGVGRRLSWARSPTPMKHENCEERNEPATRTKRGRAAIQSPRKPDGLSHCIFECLIVEASSQAQNDLSVLADRHTERRRWVFDCTGDGECDHFGSGWTR
jgi:hypothetical protein